ncbi:MAG: hypothetical protein E4H14_04950 [Candidatus Thorarchaeota archaeon]|nr:MAG: hypothetical protein E4H14_04950 [Candidatus Thorarchaeota archaeon]
MDLVEACLKANGREAVKAVRTLLPSVKPSAIWAIIMHAAAWHEERSFDTSHATIAVYIAHRMIESLGDHPSLITEEPVTTQAICLPDEQRLSLQEILLERLAYFLADTNHWRPEHGPRYDIQARLDSRGNAVQVYVQSIRENSQMSALKAAAVLGARPDRTMLIRATASIAAEEPDKLGHAFIMPTSLVMEIPAPEYTRPHMASLWHLTEFLARKVSSKAVDGFSMDEKFGKYAKPTDLSSRQEVFLNSVVNYGTIGHNAILAHRISEAARLGLVNADTIEWLLKKLERNIGTSFKTATELTVEHLIGKNSGQDWLAPPEGISLPTSKKVGEWIDADYNEQWNAMIDRKSADFENMIPELNKDSWSIVRALQYTMAAIYGDIEDAHPLIFTQAVWSLVDNSLIPENIAMLQVHRMLRAYLKN